MKILRSAAENGSVGRRAIGGPSHRKATCKVFTNLVYSYSKVRKLGHFRKHKRHLPTFAGG